MYLCIALLLTAQVVMATPANKVFKSHDSFSLPLTEQRAEIPKEVLTQYSKVPAVSHTRQTRRNTSHLLPICWGWWNIYAPYLWQRRKGRFVYKRIEALLKNLRVKQMVWFQNQSVMTGESVGFIWNCVVSFFQNSCIVAENWIYIRQFNSHFISRLRVLRLGVSD